MQQCMYLSLLDAPRCCARFMSRNLHVIPAFMHTLSRIILAFRYVVSTLFQRATHYFHADIYIYICAPNEVQ